MKQKLIIFSLIVVVIIASTYNYFSKKEFIFHFSESQIQEKLNEKLPITKTYLLIFQVTLNNPRVNLKDNAKKVNAGLDVALNIKAGNEIKSLKGSLDVSTGIKYVKEQGEFFLDDPIIERVVIQGIPDQYTAMINSALTKALVAYYADRPIYTLSATDAKHLTAKLVLKNVIIENHELVVTLGI